MTYEEELKLREEHEKYKTDRLGAASLLTIQSHTNSSRLIMSNHQIGHAVNIADPEPALVSTGFEAPIGQFSAMIEKADADEKVIYKIEKNIYSYILITYSKAIKRFNVYKRAEIEEHSEGFCTQYKNTYIDSLEIGSIIRKGEVIKKSEAFDKNMNYCIGRNLNTLYTISVNTMEDQIRLMNGADKMMDMYVTETRKIPINDNDILLNMYGDDDEYKTMPDIGKKIKKGILLAVRAVDNAKSPYSLKKKYLKRTEAGDRIYYADGRVIDVDIHYNKDKSKLIDSPTNVQINGFYLSGLDYYRDIYEALSRIIENAESEGYTYTDELSIVYKEAKDYLDSSAYYSDNENVFGNLLMEVKILNRKPIVDGSKMVGRSGNKGIVSIAPPNEYYVTESGVPIHCVVDALGVVGRLNPSILDEHALNASALVAQDAIKNTDDLSEKYKALKDFLKVVNPEEAQYLKLFYEKLNDDQKEIFFKKIEKNGIVIIQDPIENCDLYDYEKMMKKYPPKLERIVFPDGTKSLRRVIVAPQYFMRLKQDPIEKFAARSRGMINPLYLLPTKSTLKKQGLDLYSDIAVRIGESEIDVLLLCNQPEAIADYMAENSTSSAAKEEMANQYTNNLDDDLIIENLSIGNKKNRELIDANMEVLGSIIEIEYEDD